MGLRSEHITNFRIQQLSECGIRIELEHTPVGNNWGGRPAWGEYSVEEFRNLYESLRRDGFLPGGQNPSEEGRVMARAMERFRTLERQEDPRCRATSALGFPPFV
jgi:hypothetical protein